MDRHADRAAAPSGPALDPRAADRPGESTAGPGVLAVIAAGGAIGSAARYGVGLLLPADPTRGLPWSTLAVNAVGCLLIGVLMVLVTEAFVVHRLVRPFVGVGLLGGFTTFSTYTAEVRTMLARDAGALGPGYLVLTVVVALAAVTVGVAATRVATRAARRGRRRA